MMHLKKSFFIMVSIMVLVSCGDKSQNYQNVSFEDKSQNYQNDKKAYNNLNELRYDEVYVCKGKYSKRFHNDLSCKGLSKCRGGIKIMTIEEAEDIGKTPCGYCYK